MVENLNIQLSDETGEETQEALNKYKSAFNLSSQEEAIRLLLPEWAFNPVIPEEMGLLQEFVDESKHVELDFSQVENIDELAALTEEVDNNI